SNTFYAVYEGPVNLFVPPRLKKIIGVFAFLVPGRYLIRTSSLPPYGVAHQKLYSRSNLTLIG
ncbi:hypothetical protein, partial [Klebsiella pneumoniae]|uniref:hypothetical protein n=3 Tax=Klebsiella/Raoultella group TaxID=2890311 RepID=UPI000E3557F4